MKIQKYLFVFIILIFCPLLAFGQLKHELKIVPLDLFSTFTPSYELIINKKFGIEVEMSFESREVILFDGAILGSNFSSEAFDRKRFIPGISGKYYFSSNKHGSGFYIGPHFKLIFNTFIEDAFENAYFQRFNTASPYWGRKGFQSFQAGLTGGYKWLLIKEHLTIEPLFLLTSLYAKGENGMQGGRGFDVDMEIRVGYRF